MFFQKKKQERLTEYICPCLTLSNVKSLVVLPGVRYDITFDKQMSDNIIEYFKQHRDLNFDTIKKIELEMHLNEGVPTSKLVPPTKESTKSDKSMVTYPNFLLLNKYVCLIPGKSLDYATGCISKIVNVTRDGPDSYMISFKAIRRGGIVTPLYNSDGQIWGSDIIMFNEWNKLNDMHVEKVNWGTLQLIDCIDQVEQHILEFNSRYRNALKSNSKEHMLLLTPLSNTLYFQLNKEQFKSSWNLIFTQFQSLKNEYITKGSNEISYKFLKLIDFIMSVLPTSSLQKLEFLSALELDARVETFIKITNDFNQIFEQLFFSLEYINKYYEGASTLEKANLIANQLRSLKVFIQDIKNANKQKLMTPTTTHQKSITSQTNEKTNSTGKFYHKYNNTTSDKEYSDNEESDEDEYGSNDELSQIKKFIHSLKQLKIHKDGQKLLKKDFKRLSSMTPTSAECQVMRNYFDIILDIPFNKYTHQKEINILQSKRQLDKDHFGLYSVKKRLLEYLCVLKLNDQLNDMGKPPILLLVGPPGVGKTSIAKSVATVLNRNYQRISLGGVHDESDLRGHRRTYVGSMCGNVINSLRKSGTMNPLILLDEIDKVASSMGPNGGTRRSGGHGDPAAALLEILDPEQNFSFTDHFVGFPVDLSQVLFICTANDITSISKPLLDRMEVINIPGYTIEDKIQIGSQFLLPKQIKLNGLNKCENGQFTMTLRTWELLVSEYTRESGVRSLQREISKIVRGKVSEYIENDNHFPKDNEIKPNQLIKYLGFPLHPITKELLSTIPYSSRNGIVNGLSYNSDGTGGVLIFEIIEVGENRNLEKDNMMEGPHVKSTGNLGNILQESIDIGLSVVKSILQRDIIDLPNVKELYCQFTKKQFHLHVPMGSISKDGPSAGMAITLALMSMALQKPIDPMLCMTGEITLRGKILPIGGLKEKLLGAKMYGMKRVFIPQGNRNDVIEGMMYLDDSVLPNKEMEDLNHVNELSRVYEKMGLQATYVKDIYDVLPLVWPDIKLKPLTQEEHNLSEGKKNHEMSLSSTNTTTNNNSNSNNAMTSKF